MKETERLEEELLMKSFKNQVEQLFNSVRCSTEYKATLAEELAYKWRSISDNQINRALQLRARKEQKDVNEQAGDSHILGK